MVADEGHIKRERAKAKELRASQWWKQQIGPGLCHHCGKKFSKTDLTMDHLIPVARGGKSSKHNVVPSCRPCNQTRGHKLDVERKFDELSAKQVWLNEEHRQTLGQTFENLDCFGVTKYYFDGQDLRRFTADEMLTWVSHHFTQVELSTDFVEPVLVLVWVQSSNLNISGAPKAAPNVYDLAKRAPGFPFCWVLEHSFVVVSSLADASEDIKAGFTEIENVFAFHKASAKPEDVVRVEPVKEVLRASRELPGFALTFHVPTQHQ